AIGPGESGVVQIDLERPVGALWGDRVVLRDHAARHTLAGGHVVDPFAPRRGRRQPARLAALAALATPDPTLALTGLLAIDGMVGLPQFALARNLAPAELDTRAQEGRFLRVGPARASVAVTPARLAELCDKIVDALAAWHRAQPDTLGPNRPALFGQLRRKTPEAALEAALSELVGPGPAARQGPIWRLPEHHPRLTRRDKQLGVRVGPLLAPEALPPPRVRELAAALGL